MKNESQATIKFFSLDKDTDFDLFLIKIILKILNFSYK